MDRPRCRPRGGADGRAPRDLTGEAHHAYEAVLARPDLPVTQAALGCALGRAGKHADAALHLRAALAADPFDRDAARGFRLDVPAGTSVRFEPGDQKTVRLVKTEGSAR